MTTAKPFLNRPEASVRVARQVLRSLRGSGNWREGGLDFRILGPLEVWDDGRRLPLPGGKPRAVLALLLLNANEVVSADRVIDQIWAESPPETAQTALHGYVSRLRKVLGAEALSTQPGGYAAVLEPGQLDV